MVKKEKKALELKKTWVAMGASVVLASQMMMIGGAAAKPAKPAASSEASPAVQPKVEAGVEQKGDAGQKAEEKQSAEGKKNTEGKQNVEAKRNNEAKPKADVMTDNLSKYGLKKDLELPVTVEAGGLKYTLEKIMIFETKSKDAQALIKKYGYTGLEDDKYFIWTMITVENKSGSIAQRNSKDLSEKWRLHFGSEAYPTMPLKTVDVPNYKPNNKEALWSWVLKPGEKLSTYQAYSYNGKLEHFVIWLDFKGKSDEKYIVEQAGK